MLPFLSMLLSQAVYSESLRPQFHFTPRKGWMNDPNGLVFSNGEYHLFFQHNPNSTEWNDMHWGHAVSPDLIHWKQLPEAIGPDELGTIWSGSAVVDPLNTAGFGKKALICMYTAAGNTSEASKGKTFTQCLAYSLDGIHCTKNPGNPVLQQIHDGNRDPKLNWYQPDHSWILALYLEGDRYGLFKSKDLQTWTRTDTVEMPNASECPDFFELPQDDNRNNRKWVFWGASGYYRVGSFDGSVFKPDTGTIASNFGNSGYAAQSFYNEPNGRRVQITWLRDSNFPNSPWNQQLGFPNELRLRSTPEGPRLTFEPVAEIEELHSQELQGTDGWYPSPDGLMDISVRAKAPPSGTLTLTVNGIDVRCVCHPEGSRGISGGEAPSLQASSEITFSCLGKTAETKLIDEDVDVRVLADRASIEIYANHGLLYMPMFVLPNGLNNGLRAKTEGDWNINRLTVWQLRSAWHQDGPFRGPVTWRPKGGHS